MIEKTLKEKLSVKDKWFRVIFMVLFICIQWITKVIVWIILIFQFLYSLFTGKPLKTLIPFSDSLSTYIKEIIAFLTYVTEEKPFPFNHWPESKFAEKPAKVSKK